MCYKRMNFMLSIEQNSGLYSEWQAAQREPGDHRPVHFPPVHHGPADICRQIGQGHHRHGRLNAEVMHQHKQYAVPPVPATGPSTAENRAVPANRLISSGLIELPRV
jgi:Periviscerokinin family